MATAALSRPTLDGIMTDIEQLSDDDRDVLWMRLSDIVLTPTPEVEASWAAELARRVRDLDEGRVTLLDEDEADALMFGSLDD